MQTTLFDVRFIDHTTGTLKYTLPPQQIIGLKYDTPLRDVGAFVLTTAYTDSLWDAYTLDDFIEVYSYIGGVQRKEATYLLRGREVYYENSVQQIALKAVGLNDLIARRLILPDSTGYNTKAGDAVTVVAAYADETLGPSAHVGRRIPLLTINTSGTGAGVGARVRYESLLDTLQTLAEKGQIDFMIERTTGRNLELLVGRLGANKTYTANYPIRPALVFTPERGNVLDARLNENRTQERNYVFVLGEGEGASQFVYQLTGSDVTLSNYNRVETKVTQRRNETDLTSQTEQAVTKAVEVLRSGEPQIEFDFDLPATQSAGLVYGVDYELGDTITVAWRGVQVDLRVTDCETALAPSGSLTRTLKLRKDNGA